MGERIWSSELDRCTVCIDSYDSCVLQGSFYSLYQDAQSFKSMSQFLLKMEEVLDDMQKPQAYTSPRRFSAMLQPETDTEIVAAPKGELATFELKVIFRQHSSWQGVLLWREKGLEHSFRSVLELIILMDSALRELEGSGAA